MKHLTIHPSLDAFKGEKDNLLRPHVALIKGGVNPILAYSQAGKDFTAHESGNAAFVDLGGSPITTHGGVVVEYDFTSNKRLGTGELYNAIYTMYLDGQIYDIDNLVVDVASGSGSGSASASGSGSGAGIAGSISMPDSITGHHTVEFVIGNHMFYAPRILKNCEVIGTPTIPEWNTVEYHANGYEFVDLGLPSGRLWATKNIYATYEIDLGKYWQWGDTMGSYIQADEYWPAPYVNGSGAPYEKYDGHGSRVLEYEDDAACREWRGSWHIPSIKDFKELKKYCSKVFQQGWTGFVGPNGNELDMPNSVYWASELSKSDILYACAFYITDHGYSSAGNQLRCKRSPIRAVL